MKFYQLADQPHGPDLKNLGLDGSNHNHVNPFRPGHTGLVAIKTDQKRPPKRGEWYLSGAEPEAWRATNDLTATFRILRLVTIQTTLRSSICSATVQVRADDPRLRPMAVLKGELTNLKDDTP